MSTRKVFKYPLTDEQMINHVEMPVGARVLSAGSSLGTLCVWAIVDPDAPKERRTFDVVANGESFDDVLDREFIGTVIFGGGVLVAHIFEAKPLGTVKP